MEFMKGGSLAERIKVKVLTEKETAIVVRQILLGLEHLHSENKIHRDIKAANILIREDGRIKLGDLGASAQLTLTKPSTDTMIGNY
jgi:serine/threonine-protein kinase 24/25/MST4